MQSFIVRARRGRAGGRSRVSIGPWQGWDRIFGTATRVPCRPTANPPVGLTPLISPPPPPRGGWRSRLDHQIPLRGLERSGFLSERWSKRGAKGGDPPCESRKHAELA